MTAEELLEKYRFKAGKHIGNSDYELMCKFAIEFAKHHVENALQAASDIATVSNIYSNNSDEWVNKDEILNSYPLTNIK